MQCAQGSHIRTTLLIRTMIAYIKCTLMNSKAANRLNLPKENDMFKALFAMRRRRSFQWKPAVDLSNPRVAASLTTFPTN